MTAPDVPFPMQSASIEFGEDPVYRLLDDLVSEGCLDDASLKVQQYHSGARMSVEVGAGDAYVSYNSPYGGVRRVRQPALTDSGTPGSPNVGDNWTATFTTSDATNPRIDRVVAKLKDTLLDASGLNRLEFAVVVGAPTGGATLVNLSGAAAVPDNALLLANVLIPAGSSSITTSNIDTTFRATRPAAGIPGRLAAPPPPIDFRNPSSGNSNCFPTVAALTAWQEWHWEFVKDVDGYLYGIVRVPWTTSAGKIELMTSYNATTGVARWGAWIARAADGSATLTFNPASFTALTAIDMTVPGTARVMQKVVFPLGTTINAGELLMLSIAHLGAHANDTVAVNSELIGAWLLPN